MNLNDLSDLFKYNGRILKMIENLLVLFLKYGRKIPVAKQNFQKRCRLKQFSKVSLHFKKRANSSRKVLQKYSEIYSFCVIQYIGFQKQSVGGALKVLGKPLKTVLGEVHFIVNLYSSPYLPVPQVNTFPLGKSFVLLPPSKTSPSSRHINNSLSVYLFLESELFQKLFIFVTIKAI